MNTKDIETIALATTRRGGGEVEVHDAMVRVEAPLAHAEETRGPTIEIFAAEALRKYHAAVEAQKAAREELRRRTLAIMDEAYGLNTEGDLRTIFSGYEFGGITDVLMSDNMRQAIRETIDTLPDDERTIFKVLRGAILKPGILEALLGAINFNSDGHTEVAKDLFTRILRDNFLETWDVNYSGKDPGILVCGYYRVNIEAHKSQSLLDWFFSVNMMLPKGDLKGMPLTVRMVPKIITALTEFLLHGDVHFDLRVNSLEEVCAALVKVKKLKDLKAAKGEEVAKDITPLNSPELALVYPDLGRLGELAKALRECMGILAEVEEIKQEGTGGNYLIEELQTIDTVVVGYNLVNTKKVVGPVSLGGKDRTVMLKVLEGEPLGFFEGIWRQVDIAAARKLKEAAKGLNPNVVAFLRSYVGARFYRSIGESLVSVDPAEGLKYLACARGISQATADQAPMLKVSLDLQKIGREFPIDALMEISKAVVELSGDPAGQQVKLILRDISSRAAAAIEVESLSSKAQ
jgi:hypothetical protein